MGDVLLVARIGLACVLLVAGVTKLLDSSGTRRAIADFGVPAGLVPSLSLLLPVSETVVALVLIPNATMVWGALGALALLSVFTAGIAFNLARGRKPDCHCFGQLHSEPIGWSTLIRTGFLLTIAALIVEFGPDNLGPGPVSWFGSLTAAEKVGGLAAMVVLGLLVAQGWLVFHLMRQHGRILLRVETLENSIAEEGALSSSTHSAQALAGLPVGTQAPNFTLSDLEGETLTLDSLRGPGKELVLLFSDPDCGPCDALMPSVSRWQQEYSQLVNLVLISRGSVEINRTKAIKYGLARMLLQEDREVAHAYQANGTPSAVVVRPDGIIGSSLARGEEQIEKLVERSVSLLSTTPATMDYTEESGREDGAVRKIADPDAPKLGAAPAIQLPDLNGNTVDLADFRGGDTLMLFWDPECAFCLGMLSDLRKWEDQAQSGKPQLLIISSGTRGANQAMGLRSTIVLDHNFSTGRAFGAPGTPSALVVNADGKVASHVAVGAPAVMELANGRSE